MTTFAIEDDLHAEAQGTFPSYDEALAELRRRAQLRWDEEPNVAPCTSWRTCGRDYEVVEYDTASRPWRELRRVRVLSISASGTTLHVGAPAMRRPT